MASYQDNVPFVFSSTKLPVVVTADVGLDTDIGSSLSRSAVDENWASVLRMQIDHSINTSGRPQKDLIVRLHKKLIKFIVLVLQPNSSRQTWVNLTSALKLIEPYSKFLNGNHGQALQTRHYIERLYIAFHKDEVQESDIPLLECLKKVFPTEFALVVERFNGISHERSFWREMSLEGTGCKPRQNNSEAKPVHQKQHHTMVLPDGKNPYSALKTAENQAAHFGQRAQLTFGDLRQAFSVVALESAAYESMWKGSRNTTVDGPFMRTYVPDSSSLFTQSMGPVPKEENTPRFVQSMRERIISGIASKSITGREAVELFTTKKHLNIVQFMYFNIAEGRYYTPYDLLSVPQDEVNSEHYIFSNFGVLHVYADGSTSETMSLSEWNRMAVLWGIVSKIKFFKNFLAFKSLRNWRFTIRRQRLLRTRTFLENNLVHVVPEFGLALIHVMRLVTELCDLQLLPNKSYKISEHPLTAFSMMVSKREREVEKLLEAFFTLCKKVTDATRQECFNQLKHCEYQVQHQKTLFNKESLYIQRRKKLVRRMNLEKAQHAVKELSTFMSLVGQIISVHLLQVVQNSIRGYVYGVLCLQEGMVDEGTLTLDGNSTSANVSKGFLSTHSTKRASAKHSEPIKMVRSIFIAKLVFHPKNHHLEMQPSPERFKNAVCSCIPNLISTICKKANSVNNRGKFRNKEGGDISQSVRSIDSSASVGSSRSSSTRSSLEIDKTLHVDQLDGEAAVQSFVDTNGVHRTVTEKEESKMGTATPNLITSSEPHERLGLMITGRTVMGQYNPLDQSSLKNRLTTDPKILEAIQVQKNAVNNALQEVEKFCLEHNEWLVPIRAFTARWRRDILKEWKGKPVRDIENTLNQIKDWSDKIKTMDQTFLCSNRLLLLDCKAPQAEVISVLSSIFKQIISLVTSHAKELSLDVTTNSKNAIKLLEKKDLSIKSFAAYARKVIECQQMKGAMAKKVEYIRELHEVVRMVHRQLTHDEEKLEEKVKSTWEAFVFQLKDASNFVSNQQPIILKQLDEMFQEKYVHAKTLSKYGSSGAMTDPSKPPSEVIAQLKSVTAKFSMAHGELHELSSCREAILGEKYNLDELAEMAKVIEARLELWQSVNLSFEAINEWKSKLFRRFNVQAAIDRVLEWQKSSKKFEKVLSENDNVLRNWSKLLSDFLLELPLLQKMSDQAMKSRHWKQIFTGLGQNFGAEWTLTVKDLLSYNLLQQANLINQVCHGAIAEYSLERILRDIKEKWELKQFQLAKHIHVVRTETKKLTTARDNERERKSVRSRNQKSHISLPPKLVMQEIDSETYVLVESRKLLSELSDSHVTLQSMLQSRHATEIRTEAEIWSDTFQQLAEIIDLWTSCQNKWMYLNLVFHNDCHLSVRFPEKAIMFEDMDKRYREFIKAVVHDPKVLSVLSRRHGQKGWRELQGENLRRHIMSCIRMQEELLFSVSHLLEEFRSEFPRMYFLSDDDCICLLAISRQPKLFAPYVLKCFGGVKSLIYDLPHDGLTGGATLDLDLNSHKLQVARVQGKNGEFIDFITPLVMQTDAISWMKLFESKLASSLKKSLVELICQHSTGSALNLKGVFEEVHNNPTHLKPDHWLLTQPSQIILLCESIFWTINVHDILTSSSRKDFQEMLLDFNHRIDKYSQIIRKSSRIASTDLFKKIYSTASVAISQALYHRDVIIGLKQNLVSSATSFQWQKIIKHRMETPLWEFEFIMKAKPLHKTNVFIEHMGTPVAKYGMEYESSYLDGGNDSHSGMPFMMTPFSDRHAFSLCIAIQLGKCGTLIGPEASGKSCLIMQLARIFGRPLINLNCSKEIGIPVLLRALCGMVESQCFLCFDQAQILPKSVMSSLIQQMRIIQLAFSMLSQCTKRQYDVRGSSSCKSQSLKRCNSIPSLHSIDEKDGKNASGSKSRKWIPEIDEIQLSKIHRYKKDDMSSYVQKTSCEDGSLGSIMFNGRLLRARGSFGMFMTLNCCQSSLSELPHNLKLIYRPVTFVAPRIEKIAEMWLIVNGFLNSNSLATKILLSAKIAMGIRDRANSSSTIADGSGVNKAVEVTLKDVRSMVALAGTWHISRRSSLTTSGFESTDRSFMQIYLGDQISSGNAQAVLASHHEEYCLGTAVLRVMSKKFSSEIAISRLKDLLQSLFPHIERPKSGNEDQLLISVRRQFLLRGLIANPKMVAKVDQLNSTLKHNKAVMLVGPAGCGKTTIYRTLAQSLNSMATGDGENKTTDILKTEQSQFKITTQIDGDDQPHSSISSQGIGKSVDISVLYPNVLSTEDLFGSFENTASGVWTQGVLSKILKYRSDDATTSDPNQQPDDQFALPSMTSNRLKKWIVLDGELSAPWIENVNCLLDINKLQNLDSIKIPDGTSIIFEATDLTNVSPALFSRCSIVHCTEANHWKWVLFSWLDSSYGKYAITRKIIEVWREMLDDLVPKTLDFLQHLGRNILNHRIMHGQKVQQASLFGISEVTSFIHILSSLLDLHLDRNVMSRREQREGSAADYRPHSEQTLVSENSSDTYTSNKSQLDNDIPDFHHQLATNFFGFAFVWAFGGKLLASDMPQFDVFFRNLLSGSRHEIKFPIYENVFEYFVDPESGQFTVWEDKIDLRPHAPPTGLYYSYVHQIERYSFLSSLLLRSQHPVLIIGKSGCGKSSMVSNILQEEHELTHVAVSPGLTPQHLQKVVESHSSPHHRQHNIGLMAHPNAVIDTRSQERHKALLFLDDLSSAPSALASIKSEYAIQPVHEVVRQVLCIGGLYDKEHQMMKTLEGDINFLAAANIPGDIGSGLGYSTHLMSPRLTRLFTVIHFLEPSKEAILSIYHNIVQSWLEEFPAYTLSRHYELSQAIIAGAVEVYSSVSSHFKPTPRQPTYMFSLHDVSHVMKGLFLLAPRVRGRLRPVRRKPALSVVKEDGGMAGNVRRQRPIAGRPGQRLRPRQWGDQAYSVSPLMRTIIRLWLHECSRTFYDRLTNENDRHWFSKSLAGILKKHFCTAPHEERAATPGIGKNTVEDVPRPSGMSISDSSYTGTASSSTGVESRNCEIAKSGKLSKGIKKASSDIFDEDVDMRYDSGQEIYQDATGSPGLLFEDEETLHRESTSLSFADGDNEGFSSSSEPASESSAILEDSSEKNEDFIIQESSEGTYEMEFEKSLPDTSVDLRTDYDEESQSQGTAATAEIESDTSSETDDEDSNVETQSTKSELSYPPQQTNSEPMVSVEINTLEPSTGPRLKSRQKRISNTRPGGAKLGVTFVPGLINDPDCQTATEGALAKFDQILSENEDPTSILFSKNILRAVEDGSGEYCESTAEQLVSALHQAQVQYNENSHTPLDLVFFRQAVEHLARLSRVLSMSEGGHAVCFSSMRFSGKKSLCLLASFLCKARVVNGTIEAVAKTEDVCQRERLKRFVSEASMSAGIKNENTVLLLDEIFTSDVECLGDLCGLVKNGQYPSLYSQFELVTLATEMSLITTTPFSKDPMHHQGSTAADKLDLCLQSYFKRVISNLHIVLLMRSAAFDGNQDLSLFMQTSQSSYFHHSHSMEWLHAAFKRCPEILTRFSCIDLFKPWNHLAWVKISKKYLSDFTNKCSKDSGNGLKIPWSSNIPKAKQVLNICHIMSYIHQDALSCTRAILPKSAERLVTPTTLRTLVGSFVNIAIKIGEDESRLLTRYKRVLKKIDDADADLARYSLGREGLLPLLQAAVDSERSWKRHVEHERREYSEARERCNIEEESIERLEEELLYFRQDAKLAFDEVNPFYNVAVEAMQALTMQGLDELKRYKKPPDSAVVVVKALCDLFEVKPANWENGKSLLMRDNLFEEMEFFDKDNMPEHIYQALTKNVKDPEFQPIQVGKGSKAAECLCSWMHAIHSYAKLSRYLAPKIAKLKEAETKLKKAEATLGVKRVRCNQIKKELDLKIQAHKDAYTAMKQYEQDLENLGSKITKARILMGNLAEYITHWRRKRDSILSRLNSATGDGLLAAACLTYHSPLSKNQRNFSLQKWTVACLNGRVYESSGAFEILSEHPAQLERLPSHDSSSLSDETADDCLPIFTSGMSSVPLVYIRIKLDPYKLVLPKWVQHDWQKVGLPKDEGIHSTIAALLAGASYQQSSWPLIFDPDSELRIWIKEISKLCYNQISADDGEKYFISDGNQTSENSDLASGSLSRSEMDEVETSTETANDHLSETETEQHASQGMDFNMENVDTNQEMSVKTVICEADNPLLEQQLEESVLNGSVIFVTHLERAEFPVIHHLVLLRDQLLYIDEGGKQKYSSTYHIPVHRNFRLFLSTSIALKQLDMVDSLHFPVEICNCIDFSLDADGLEEKINYYVMAQEKPDFQNHYRLLEADIFHLEQQRKALQMNLLSKVSGSKFSLFSDPFLIDAVRLCQREMSATNIALSETNMMESKLLQKTSDLCDVANCCKMVYEAVLQVSVMKKNLYHWTATTFLSLFVATMKSTVRVKLNISATPSPSAGLPLKSRAAELNQIILETVLLTLKQSMFKEDYLVFAAIVSLTILQRQNKLTKDEVNSFIFGIEKKKANSSPKSKNYPEKPVWMTQKTWEGCQRLQQKHPTFKGLTDSLSSKQIVWHEYLYSQPVLQANVPSDIATDLNIGQKALLWKTLRPDLGDEIVLKMSACLLGSASTKPYHWNVRQILEKTKKNTPVTFLVPTTGSVYDPAVAILKEAKSQKILTTERSAPLPADVTKVLQNCMTHGHWLIIHECDLEANWSEELVQQLYLMCKGFDDANESFWSCDSKNKSLKELDEETSSFPLSGTKYEDGVLDSEKSNKSSESVLINELKTRPLLIHQDFRLWLILKQDDCSHSRTSMPEILARKGTIVNLSFVNTTVTLMNHNFELVSQAENAPSTHGCQNQVTTRTKPDDPTPDQMFKICLSLLHTILAQPRLVQPYAMQSDISDMYRLYQRISDARKQKFTTTLCEELVKSPTLNERNTTILRSVIDDCFLLDGKDFNQNSSGRTIKENFARMFSIQHNLTANLKYLLKNTVRKDSVLPIVAQLQLLLNKENPVLEKIDGTRRYLANCSGTVDHTQAINESVLLANETIFIKTLENLAGQVNNLHSLKLENLAKAHQNGPLSYFYRAECLRLIEISQILQNDIRNCIDAVRGEIEMTSVIFVIIEYLKQNKLPSIWMKLHPEIFHFYSDITVSGLVHQIQLIISSFTKHKESVFGSSNIMQIVTEVDDQKCSSQVQTPPCYNLAHFLRPDMFLDSVLAEFKQPAFKVELFPEFKPLIPGNVPMTDCIVIHGIRLHGAVFDSRSHTLKACTSTSPRNLPPIRLTPVSDQSDSTISREESRTFVCPLFHNCLDGDALLNIPMLCEEQPASLHLKNVFAFTSF